MNRALRYAGVAMATVALLAGGSAVAFAAQEVVHTPAPVVATAPATAALTAKASATTVNAWQQFRITGAAKGIKPGTKITVQQKQHTKWVSLPAQAPINTSGSYAVRVKLGIKGVNELRIAVGSTVSPIVKVTVR
ncbi:hypothetical protein ACFVT2_00260 [Streptomyces sp. NPDC058000]|uniref:hypothetical protein n=1 Tax=Streptomyces sp. NPDC058000 TaxID=3346299 RepID=UPI0036EDCFFC